MSKALVVLIALGLFYGYPLARAWHRSDVADYSRPPDVSYAGWGASWKSPWAWPLYVQGPFAQLDIYNWGIRLRGKNGLGWMLPVVELAWSEIAYVEYTKVGVRFTRKDNPNCSALFKGSRDEIRQQLDSRPVKVRQWEPQQGRLLNGSSK